MCTADRGGAVDGERKAGENLKHTAEGQQEEHNQSVSHLEDFRIPSATVTDRDRLR